MSAANRLPGHVPADMVRSCDVLKRGYTRENPFKTMIDAIHDGPEIFYTTDVFFGQGWVLRRAEDLKDVYLDTDHFSNRGLTVIASLIGENWVEIPVELDPPLHGQFRTLLNPLFSVKNISRLEDHVRSTARRYIAEIKARGECEFMADFAFPAPVSVFLGLLGLPQEDMPQFLQWEHSILHETDMPRVAQAVREAKAYMLDVIAERRVRPGDDFISHGVHATVDGRPLSEDELIGYCFNLFVGGLDTISTSVGWSVRHLAETPEHQGRLRNDPALIPMAMEELFRAYAPATTFRICVKETMLRGRRILPGDRVAMSTSIACRDPEAFHNPTEVVLDRRPNHITFAYGPHRCIGAALARLEVRIALEEFLSAVPAFEITPGADMVSTIGGVIQTRTLPLSWTC